MANDGQPTKTVLAQTQAERPTHKEMPQAINRAVLATIKAIRPAIQGGEGEEGIRTFRYTTINDVLDACHDGMIETDLGVKPIEIHDFYSEEILSEEKIRVHYAYKFRLMHAGLSWVDEEDIRHVTVVIPATGIGSGKAQSLALRDYLKGLFRIRTQEPEADVATPPDQRDAPQKGVSAEGGNGFSSLRPRAPTVMFNFGIFGQGGPQSYTLDEAEMMLKKIVAPQRYSERKQWESDEVNATGLRELSELDKPRMLRWRKLLDDLAPTEERTHRERVEKAASAVKR